MTRREAVEVVKKYADTLQYKVDCIIPHPQRELREALNILSALAQIEESERQKSVDKH